MKPINTRPGQHPDQKKGQTADDTRVAASIWPRAYEGEGGAHGKQLTRGEDLRGRSLSQEHAVGYSTNSGTTPSQEQEHVTHSRKGPALRPRKSPVAHKGAPPKVDKRPSGRTAKASNPGYSSHTHR